MLISFMLFKAEGAALKIIINSENLDVIQHLHTVVTVQAAFIKRFVVEMCFQILFSTKEVFLKNKIKMSV